MMFVILFLAILAGWIAWHVPLYLHRYTQRKRLSLHYRKRFYSYALVLSRQDNLSLEAIDRIDFMRGFVGRPDLMRKILYKAWTRKLAKGQGNTGARLVLGMTSQEIELWNKTNYYAVGSMVYASSFIGVVVLRLMLFRARPENPAAAELLQVA